ncbi:MAG: hypothetical protein O2968_16825 [Acidobacteria bacterium]|nr:hypothetical protein [Acidobacteriota bacterium]
MKNITLSVDDEVLSAVRRYAVERESSVNALVREYLTNVAAQQNRARGARRAICKLSDHSPARIGGESWKRTELHER